MILVQGAVNRSLDDTLATKAADVGAQLSEGQLGGADPVQLPPLDPRDPVVVQVLGPEGRLLAATPGVSRGARICAPAQAVSRSVGTHDLGQPGLTGTFRVLAVSARRWNSGTVTICAARSDEQAELIRDLVIGVLGFAVPAVTVLACLLVRRHVGAALAVVGDLAHEAGQLQNLDQGRLNVSATGDEVQDLGETFNELLDRVHSQAKAVRQFVADAGHELRTPLASLQVCLDLAADADPGQARAAVRDGLIDVERLAGMVDDLLKLARADAGEPPSPTRVTLPEALLGQISGVRRARPDLSVDLEGGPVAVCVDVTALGTAVGNLLSNAARHARSRMLIRIGEESGRATVEVVDDGPGVPVADLQRIFQRFVRLDDARTRDAGGIGLGLSIAAALAQRDGGRVTAFPGPGGRFLLELPIHRFEQRSQPDAAEVCPSASA